MLKVVGYPTFCPAFVQKSQHKTLCSLTPSLDTHPACPYHHHQILSHHQKSFRRQLPRQNSIRHNVSCRMKGAKNLNACMISSNLLTSTASSLPGRHCRAARILANWLGARSESAAAQAIISFPQSETASGGSGHVWKCR